MLELFFTTLLCLMSLFPKDGVMVDLMPSKSLLSISSQINSSVFFFLIYIYIHVYKEEWGKCYNVTGEAQT